MPELPEVETVKNTLCNLVVGKTIVDVNFSYSRLVRDISVDEFVEKIIGQKICFMNRVGKYLIFELNDFALIVHLRMEGKFFYRKEGLLSKHDHVAFTLDDGSYLVYNDTRKFGTFNLESLNGYKKVSYLRKLGIEANSEDLSGQYLYDKLHTRNTAIKTALLNQEILSGLGNIYVDETLFLSGILPTKKCSSLGLSDYCLIANSAKSVINKAIKEGGTTIKSFSVSEGVHGRFQNHLNVHTKKKCGVCNCEVTKIKVNGRGTYYCKVCQK